MKRENDSEIRSSNEENKHSASRIYTRANLFLLKFFEKAKHYEHTQKIIQRKRITTKNKAHITKEREKKCQYTDKSEKEQSIHGEAQDICL